jgi:thiamine-phosphate pyrophosphorylase
MALSTSQLHPIMCITQDNLPLSHVEQARRLCKAGARWIQLRMKRAERSAWLAAATEVVEVCRAHHCICIINDSVDITLAAGADGVHMSRNDGNWREARRLLGPRFIIGGTVNNAEDARAQLDGISAWAIGGIEREDLATVRATGAIGAAVSSALFREDTVEKNYRALVRAWGAKASR